MACNCNCRNGQDILDFLTPYPGGTEASATYILGMTHFTCGGRNMLVADPTRPVIAQLTATPVGTPIDIGNGAFCQECQISGTVQYCPCNACEPRTEYVSQRVCLPCSAAETPVLAIGTVAASPKPITQYVNQGQCGCCQVQRASTNQIAITTSINVTPAA